MSLPAMNDPQLGFRFSALRAGSMALRTLERARTGQVAAVFASTFYADTDAGWICVGGEGVPPSPLNLVTAAPHSIGWLASGMRRGETIRLSDNVIHVGSRFSFDVSGLAAWIPAPLPAGWGVMDIERGLRALRELAMQRLPEQGLGRFVMAHPRSPGETGMLAEARRLIGRARRWLAAAIEDADTDQRELVWVGRLAGLGPGLTPSGDDLIAGMMVALHALGEEGIKRRIWEQAEPHARAAGNPISYAYLCAASRGEAGEPLHRLLAAVVTGNRDAVAECLDEIDHTGHSSGWDGTAGLVLVLEEWLRAHWR